jgi:hypothetical protein
MALDALRQLRDTGVGPVLAEEMAALAAIVDQPVVQGVIEVHRLLFLGVKQRRKNHPADEQARDQAQNKKEDDRPADPILFFAMLRSWCSDVRFRFFHGHSIVLKLF